MVSVFKLFELMRMIHAQKVYSPSFMSLCVNILATTSMSLSAVGFNENISILCQSTDNEVIKYVAVFTFGPTHTTDDNLDFEENLILYSVILPFQGVYLNCINHFVLGKTHLKPLLGQEILHFILY